MIELTSNMFRWHNDGTTCSFPIYIIVPVIFDALRKEKCWRHIRTSGPRQEVHMTVVVLKDGPRMSIPISDILISSTNKNKLILTTL
jgi:hypothetical protein